MRGLQERRTPPYKQEVTGSIPVPPTRKSPGDRAFFVLRQGRLGGRTSRDTGDDLDHLRTAIQVPQIYAEGTQDDQEPAKVHKAIVLIQSLLADHWVGSRAAAGTRFRVSSRKNSGI